MSTGLLCQICGHHFVGDPCHDCLCPADKTGRGMAATTPLRVSESPLSERELDELGGVPYQGREHKPWCEWRTFSYELGSGEALPPCTCERRVRERRVRGDRAPDWAEIVRGPDRRTREGAPEGRERRFDDVLETIRRVHEATTPDGTGTVNCARCLGTVRYEKKTLREKRPRRSRQGPVRGVWSRGKCETEGCVAWIV